MKSGSTIVAVNRRDFLKALAGVTGLILGVRLPGRALAAEAAGAAGAAATPLALSPNLFLAIAPDGVVTIVTHRSEMGTGIRTALPMVVAEELGADWSQVRIEQAPGDEKYGSQNTDGSRSIRDFYQPMREAGATARLMLEQAAAALWGVPAAECEAKAHQVHHAASGKAVGFGELVEKAAALPVPKVDALRFRAPADYRIVGTNIPIVDRTGIVTGKAVFGMDFKLEGMKYAAIARSPVLGGKPRSTDDKAALAVPGVEKVVTIPPAAAPYSFQALGGVAVIAKDTWSAFQGRNKLVIDWDPGANASYDSEAYRTQLEQTAQKPGTKVRSKGDVEKAMAAATQVHTADYYLPHLAHASMEPPVAVAHVTGDKCVAWAPTQNPQAAQDTLAAVLKLDKKNVTVHVTLLGGGFGRKSKPDYIVEAALLSREIGAPVKAVWSREDDIRHDYYHSVAAVHMEAGLDAEGKPTAWLQRSAFPPIGSTFAAGDKSPSVGELGLGFTDLPFDVPNLLCEKGEAEAHVRIGWLRSVCNVWHAFAASSFADELAAVAKKDPLEYLLALIGPDRHIDPKADGAEYENYDNPLSSYPIDTARLKKVTEVAAKAIGWGQPMPKGRGLGIASHRSFLSYVAVACEVEVTPQGQLKIPRVVIALDCGKIIHPDRVKSQMEGSVVFGVSLALMGEITAKDGKIVQSNFNDYPVARSTDTPLAIQVELLDSQELPAGTGEPGVPPVAPALANAIHAATGKRLRSLPFKKHDLSWS